MALARQLVGLAGVDVIFLDEPTNHLDIQTTEWLEDFLRDFDGAQLIVSHDRYFLDQVCNRIVEIQDLHAWPYNGNFSRYIRQKNAFEASLADRIATTEKKIKSTMGAMAQMKRANKYDKSISAKHKMIERLQQELKALKARVPSGSPSASVSTPSTRQARTWWTSRRPPSASMDLTAPSLMRRTSRFERATASASSAETGRARRPC